MGRAEEGKTVFSIDPIKNYLHICKLSRSEFQGRGFRTTSEQLGPVTG
jgi:hypothetical protein